MAPSDSRRVNRCGHGHLACKFPINVTVPSNANTGARRLYEHCGCIERATRLMVKESWKNAGQSWVLLKDL